MLTDRLIAYLETKLGNHAPENARGELSFDCPFCDDQSDTPKLGINRYSGLVHCFKCDYSASGPKSLLYTLNGGVLTLEDRAALLGSVVATNRVSRDIRQLLAPDELPSASPKLKDVPLPKDNIQLRITPHPRASAYIRSRGYADEDKVLKVISTYDIRYIRRGPLLGYLLFPVWDSRGIHWWTTRFCGKTFLKSVNPPNTPGHYTKSDVLLGAGQAMPTGKVRTLTIVEGPFSMFAVKYALSDVTRPVCLCGSSKLTQTQMNEIRTLVSLGVEEICVATDADKPHAARLLAKSLLPLDVRITRLPLDSDPCDDKETLRDRWIARRENDTVSSVVEILSGKTT